MEIFEIFRAAANPEKAHQVSAYMRNQFPFLGVQAPARRKLSRQFFKDIDKSRIGWPFIFRCWCEPERELQYLAID